MIWTHQIVDYKYRLGRYVADIALLVNFHNWSIYVILCKLKGGGIRE